MSYAHRQGKKLPSDYLELALAYLREQGMAEPPRDFVAQLKQRLTKEWRRGCTVREGVQAICDITQDPIVIKPEYIPPGGQVGPYEIVPEDYYTVEARYRGGGLFRVQEHVRGRDVASAKRQLGRLAEEGERLTYAVLREGIKPQRVSDGRNPPQRTVSLETQRLAEASRKPINWRSRF